MLWLEIFQELYHAKITIQVIQYIYTCFKFFIHVFLNNFNERN